MDYFAVDPTVFMIVTDKTVLVKVKPFYEDGLLEDYEIFPLSEISKIVYRPAKELFSLKPNPKSVYPFSDYEQFDKQFIHRKIGE